MNRLNNNEVICEGTACKNCYAIDGSGARPARDFATSLKESEKAKLIALFSRMSNHGRIQNEEKFKHEAGKIFAFKSDPIRITCFQVEKDWYLTHGFIKKRQKCPPTELGRAENIRIDFLNRSNLDTDT